MRKRQFQRVVVAVVFSLVVICSMFAMEIRTGEPRSTKTDIAHYLEKPGVAFTEWAIPGHSGTQIVSLALFSLVFYSAIAWFAMLLWDLIRALKGQRT